VIKAKLIKHDRYVKELVSLIRPNYDSISTHIFLSNNKRVIGEIDIVAEKNGKIDIIGHRVVHGGLLQGAHLIDKDLIGIIKNNSELAPLHNPLQLNAIKICSKYRQYAIFDSLFFEEEFLFL